MNSPFLTTIEVSPSLLITLSVLLCLDVKMYMLNVLKICGFYNIYRCANQLNIHYKII